MALEEIKITCRFCGKEFTSFLDDELRFARQLDDLNEVCDNQLINALRRVNSRPGRSNPMTNKNYKALKTVLEIKLKWYKDKLEITKNQAEHRLQNDSPVGIEYLIAYENYCTAKEFMDTICSFEEVNP